MTVGLGLIFEGQRCPGKKLVRNHWSFKGIEAMNRVGEVTAIKDMTISQENWTIDGGN